jgi:raffinose/stachyose/melibiose transport system permease protein
MATTAATPARRARTQERAEVTYPRKRVDSTYIVMLLPVVLLFTLFITLPAIIGMFYSFTNYEGYGTGSSSG